MNRTARTSAAFAFGAGATLTALGAVLMGQGANQPVKSETQYFVSGEGDEAHLWVREGTSLRCVGHGACAAHEHKEGHGHDHDKPAPKK
jgi:hypothetical protein